MEKLFGYLMRSLKLLKRRKILRRMVAILECIVVVATTWSLVLPAITLSGQAAAQQDGIVLEGSMDPDYAAAAPEGVDDPVREESVDPVPGGTEDSAAGEADASMSGETGDPVSGEAGNSASAEGRQASIYIKQMRRMRIGRCQAPNLNSLQMQAVRSI